MIYLVWEQILVRITYNKINRIIINSSSKMIILGLTTKNNKIDQIQK